MSELAPPLRQSLRFIKHQGWLVLLVPLIAVLAAALIVQQQQAVYRASMGIIVAQAGGNFQVQAANQQTMKNILESDVIAGRVVDSLELSIPSSELRRNLHVEVRPDSSVLVVTYDSSDGQEAVRILSEVGAEFQALVLEQLGISDSFRDTGPLQIVASVIDPPHLATDPISPQKGRILGFAGILGLALGLILAFARESLDDRIRERSEAEELFGAPVVGTLPHGFHSSRSRSRHRQRDHDALELLRANVQLHIGGTGHSFLVTSSGERGRTSIVVADLGAALARAGRKVICVDTERDEPVRHRLLETEESSNGSGRSPHSLMEVVEGTVPIEEALEEVELAQPQGDPNGRRNGFVGRVLHISAAMSTADDSEPAPIPERLSELVKDLATRADWVLIDSPAILSTGTTLSLAPAVDGVLIVAQRGRTRRGHAVDVRAALKALGVRNVGVVLLDTPSGYALPF